MTLLDTLAGELLGPKSVGELSKTGSASSEQTQQLVAAALPLLLSGMHQNAGTADGAQSLAAALAQHAPDAMTSTSAMLKKADTDDGRKIVSHILGDNEKAVTKGLSNSTGLSQPQVSSMLGQLAPVVLSLVGNYQQQQQPVQQTQASPNLAGLLGSALLGGGYQQSNQAQQNGLNVASLAGALLGGGGSSNSSAAGASLLGSLLTGAVSTSTASASTGTKPKKPASSAKPKKPATTTTTKPKKPASSITAAAQTAQSGGVNLSSLLMGLLK